MTSSSIHQLYHRAWAVPLLIGGGALTLLLVGAYRVAVTPLSMLIERLVQQCAMGVAALLTSTTLAQLGVGAVAAIVALTFFVSLAIQIFRTRRLLTTLTMCKAAVRDTRTRAHYTVLTTETPMCFTAGLLRPQIFVSTGTLDRLTAPEFASVLAHEAHHQAHRDPMKTMILRAFSHAFFFLPLFRAFVDRMKTTNEIAADAAALALPGGRSALATALYALSHHRAPSMATVASFAQSGTI
ncbi:M48 family metalloprotease, partial [Candidatus Uhrbacteria bacterium]|nr:M48 family metalloprotease [Candidatus Uhrbacteria bacterium]